MRSARKRALHALLLLVEDEAKEPSVRISAARVILETAAGIDSLQGERQLDSWSSSSEAESAKRALGIVTRPEPTFHQLPTETFPHEPKEREEAAGSGS